MMNREQRRKYQNSIKNNKAKSKCPLCGYESCFVSVPVLKPYEGVKEKFVAEDFDTVIKCEICDGTVLKGPSITKLIRPGVRLPLPLDIFQMALQYEENHPEEETKETEVTWDENNVAVVVNKDGTTTPLSGGGGGENED
jgi:hypothetical protein